MWRAVTMLTALAVVNVSVAGGDTCCDAPAGAAACCDELACDPTPPGDDHATDDLHLHPCVCLSHAATLAQAPAMDEGVSGRPPRMFSTPLRLCSALDKSVFHVPIA